MFNFEERHIVKTSLCKKTKRRKVGFFSILLLFTFSKKKNQKVVFSMEFQALCPFSMSTSLLHSQHPKQPGGRAQRSGGRGVGEVGGGER